MKKMFKYIFLLLFFAIPVNINATKNECPYGDNLTIIYDDGQATINQEFYPDVTKKYIIWEQNSGNIDISENLEINQIPELSGLCPHKIYYCKLEKTTFVPGYTDNIIKLINSKQNIELADVLGVSFKLVQIEKNVYLFYSEEQATENTELKNYPDGEKKLGWDYIDNVKNIFNSGSFGEGLKNALVAIIDNTGIFNHRDGIYVSYKECGYLDYTGSNPQATYNLACPSLTKFLQSYSSVITEYKSCDEQDAGCKSQKTTILNERETELRKYCKDVLENYDFDGGVEQDCLDACLNISETVKAMKKNNGLLNSQNGECGFSTRLASWGLNIMKWVKYVVPVFVIIFGIFDFIKAIGADKEDEMKKSQKKFTTRLIAAALIFIIPFILEFVLDKFGFTEYIDGCGVIEEIE